MKQKTKDKISATLKRKGIRPPEQFVPELTVTPEGEYNVIKFKGKWIKEHRYVWEQANGKIPTGHIIHHINGKKRDNRIENLQMMHQGDHLRLHAKTRGYFNRWKNKWMGDEENC